MWLALPNVGKLLTSIPRGRKEVLQHISRRKFKDMKLVDLDKKKLRYSVSIQVKCSTNNGVS